MSFDRKMADEVVRVSQQQTKPIKIQKWKVRQGTTVPVGRIILIYDFVNAEKPEQRKLKASQAGIIHRILAETGKVVQPGEPLYEIKACSHPTIMNDMCAECGADLRKDDIPKSTASVPMIHSIPDLKVSEEQAKKLGQADNERLIKDRKLVLLVDLDQTLIHTTNDNIPPNIKDVYHFQLYGYRSPWYHTRLRPGTHKFLESVCELYELHICTFGARNYAHMIAMFLDPEQKFFHNRILSRDECFDPTSKKANLRALFPCGDDMVCIIDDREDVWSHAANLIHVKPYHFFQHTGDINAPPGLDKHESDDKEGVDLTKIVKKSSHAKTPHNVEGETSSKEFPGSSAKDMVNSDQICNKGVGESSKVGEEVSTTKLDELKDKNKVDNEQKELDCEGEECKDETRIGNFSETTKTVSTGCESKMDVCESTEISSTSNTAPMDCKMAVDSLDDAKIDNTETTSGKVTKSEPDEIPNNKKGGSETEGKGINENNGKLKAVPSLAANEQKLRPEDNLIEIEDPDDYLVYLEDILKRIHKTYYEFYDVMESGRIPDMKKVIPYCKSKVLKGCYLVFSGLVPTRYKLEQSKAYQVARSLGAEVQVEIDDETTHLVAVRPGTAKVNAGRRIKRLKIVTSDWLWCCAERWEHADERVFPLSSKGSKNRHPPPHCSSPEHVPNYPEHDTPALRKRTPSGRFMDSINPLMSFSSDDIADMDKEVEDILDDESDDSEEGQFVAAEADNEEDDENDTDIEDANFKYMLQTEILGAYNKQPDDGEREPTKETESEEEQTAETAPKRKRSLRDEAEEDLPSQKFRKGDDQVLYEELDIDPAQDPDDNDSDSFEPPDDEDSGEWNMMGAALEREFLSDG